MIGCHIFWDEFLLIILAYIRRGIRETDLSKTQRYERNRIYEKYRIGCILDELGGAIT